ncbi:MAG TPA: hypothetical protein VHE55_05650 [Fimbriimonadaceae bacterium]|nr:hypothetical protein [Fimbriimonadaceae bacterium]
MRIRIALLSLFALAGVAARADQPPSISFDARTGVYEVVNPALGWRLAGRIDGTVGPVSASWDGREISFDATIGGTPVHCQIRGNAHSTVWFGLRYKTSSARPVVFPQFTSFPHDLRPFSFRDVNFAPPTFSLNQTSTPWLFFDGRDRSMILSPASNFLIAKMVGDGKESIGVSLNDRLKEVPNGLDQNSLLVLGPGIGKSWEIWGSALRELYHRVPATDDGSPILKSFGYWTDNGADYYYNYEPDLGYAGTLEALFARYHKEGIPLGYLQLDSWWYQKSSDDPAGRPGGASKNPKLPAGSWNRYGGTLVYRAHPDLFPDGLAAFRKKIGLPLITHGRWIDRKSPDRAKYKFSGVASVDPKWWKDVADYLQASGVVCYEQDWLDRIYENSPEMSSVAGVADAFADAMADACRRDGLQMQYCMASPRFFLQAVKYPNLTTIRTSDDRFDSRKWAPFLYDSQFADAVGARPWCDVFMSGETGNMILATLSTGPVGTGDAIGKENKANILKAVLPDAEIVRPDRPLLPCDQTYRDQSSPFLASTYTESHHYRTRYFFAFPREKEKRDVTFPLDAKAYLYDFATGKGRFVDPDRKPAIAIGDSGYAYFMLAPVSKSGIVLLGDLGKFVPTGKLRIPAIDDRADGLQLTVAFAPGEGPVELEGVSPRSPRVAGAELLRYDAATGRFAVRVQPNRNRAVVRLQ